MIRLSPRLKAVADAVRPGAKTCDVGSDHAYLPAYLYLNGVSSDICAADIADEPLENARRTLIRYSLTDKIGLVKSDGLRNIDPDTREIVIAGMGGDLISRIIDAAPWTKNADVHLVLQPMTRAAELRRYLFENGFDIREERIAREGRRVYLIISAFYDGIVREFSEEYYHFGLITPDTPDAEAFIEKQKKIITSKHMNPEEKEADE